MSWNARGEGVWSDSVYTGLGRDKKGRIWGFHRVFCRFSSIFPSLLWWSVLFPSAFHFRLIGNFRLLFTSGSPGWVYTTIWDGFQEAFQHWIRYRFHRAYKRRFARVRQEHTNTSLPLTNGRASCYQSDCPLENGAATEKLLGRPEIFPPAEPSPPPTLERARIINTEGSGTC